MSRPVENETLSTYFEEIDSMLSAYTVGSGSDVISELVEHLPDDNGVPGLPGGLTDVTMGVDQLYMVTQDVNSPGKGQDIEVQTPPKPTREATRHSSLRERLFKRDRQDGIRDEFGRINVMPCQAAPEQIPIPQRAPCADPWETRIEDEILQMHHIYTRTQSSQSMQEGIDEQNGNTVHGAVANEHEPSVGSEKPKSSRLTQREEEVLTLVCQGFANAQIADTLYVTYQTVRNHVTNILRKIGAKSRMEAAVFGYTTDRISQEVLNQRFPRTLIQNFRLLTEREKAVVHTIAHNPARSSKELAETLFIDESTLKNHTTVLLKKLTVSLRQDVALAYYVARDTYGVEVKGSIDDSGNTVFKIEGLDFLTSSSDFGQTQRNDA